MSAGFPAGVDELSRRVQALERNTKSFLPSVASSLQEQVTNLTAAVASLNNANDVKYAEFTTDISSFTGWKSSVSVTLQSISGKIELDWGGTLNGADGYFCYEVSWGGTVHISRDSIKNNAGRRVAVTGGASFAPSGYGHQVISVAKNTDVKIQLELYSEQNTVTFFGGSLTARSLG